MYATPSAVVSLCSAGSASPRRATPMPSLRHTGMGAVATRYIYGGSGWWHPFLEAGGWMAPDAALSFSRWYMNGAGMATGPGESHGDLSYLYVRSGLLIAQNMWHQIAVAA